MLRDPCGVDTDPRGGLPVASGLGEAATAIERWQEVGLCGERLAIRELRRIGMHVERARDGVQERASRCVLELRCPQHERFRERSPTATTRQPLEHLRAAFVSERRRVGVVGGLARRARRRAQPEQPRRQVRIRRHARGFVMPAQRAVVGHGEREAEALEHERRHRIRRERVLIELGGPGEVVSTQLLNARALDGQPRVGRRVLGAMCQALERIGDILPITRLGPDPLQPPQR